MLTVHSVLWPTDGSEESLRALESAIGVCRRYAAKLFILQVVPPVPVLATGMGGAAAPAYDFDVRFYEHELVKTTEQQIEELVKNRIPDDIETTFQVESGAPADTINRFAEDNDIDVIVMATNGRTGLSHFLLGSVAEKTIRQTGIPVLVIPAEKGAT